MILIFGGAYQGKLDFARENFKIEEQDIFYCGENEDMDYSKKVIYGLEEYILSQTKKGVEESQILERILDARITEDGEKIVICTDVSQGIVPLDKDQRLARETTGRAMVRLGKKADEIHRIFCGLSHKLK